MVFTVCGLRRLSVGGCAGMRRPLSVFRVCVDMHVCVPRAGCVAAGIWIGAVTGRCAAGELAITYRDFGNLLF